MHSNNHKKKSEDMSMKEDGTSSVISDEEDPSLRPLLTFREKLAKIFHSHRCQVAIVALVLIDCLLVIAELILEAKHHELEDKTLPHVLHYMSISILSVFLVEIVLKVYALGTEFFRHKLEIFDALVIVLSFALDITFWEQEGIDLIIVLRLWRVARILNGVVMSVKTQSEHKLHKERCMREGVEQELMKCRLYCNALEKEVETLRSLLQKHNIEKIPPSVLTLPQLNTINVVAEVNHVQPHN